jgi:hypothetical protein
MLGCPRFAIQRVVRHAGRRLLAPSLHCVREPEEKA